MYYVNLQLEFTTFCQFHIKANKKLCEVRSAFDNYNLISGLHTFYSQENKIYENILPPLRLLTGSEKKNLMNMLKDLNFNIKSLMAA